MADKTLADLAGLFYQTERPVGVVLDADTVAAQAVAAARFYAGHGPVKSLLPPASVDAAPPADPSQDLYPFLPWYGWPMYPLPAKKIEPGKPLAPVDWVEAGTVISQSEWSLIRPLFMLYVERENSLHLEASRNLGVDVYGRSSSEINQEISQLEMDIKRAAFVQPVISV